MSVDSYGSKFDIRGSPWLSMGVHGFPWISVDILGFPWASNNRSKFSEPTHKLDGAPFQLPKGLGPTCFDV